MNKLFSTMFSALRSKVTKYWTKFKLYTSPTVLKAKFFTKIRVWFVKLFNVKPLHKHDYYGVFRWLVSKRLAFSAVIILAVLCIAYIVAVLPALNGGNGTGIRTYRYNSIPLKFHEGPVRILADSGYVAYEGTVLEAQCVGMGTLYAESGAVVYQGAFAESMFNGEGTGYYPDGIVQYKGTYLDNLYHGVGSYYQYTGTVEYEGDYIAGLRTGQGQLYNPAGNPIFTGSFQKDDIVYSEFLEKGTTEVGAMYTGKSGVYTAKDEYSVSMPEINAIYSIADGSNTLEEEWTVDSIFVIASTIQAEGKTFSTINEATGVFGRPDYFGTAWVNLSEAVTMNLLNKNGKSPLGGVEIQSQAVFDDVYNVSSYNKDVEVYIYTYERNGLLYTFYTGGAGIDSFSMYAIELS